MRQKNKPAYDVEARASPLGGSEWQREQEVARWRGARAARGPAIDATAPAARDASRPRSGSSVVEPFAFDGVNHSVQ